MKQININRSQYKDLDEAVNQDREQSLENEIGALQQKVQDIERRFSDDVDELRVHVGRLELSQNTVLARMDEIGAPLPLPIEPPVKIGFWKFMMLKLGKLRWKLWR